MRRPGRIQRPRAGAESDTQAILILALIFMGATLLLLMLSFQRLIALPSERAAAVVVKRVVAVADGRGAGPPVHRQGGPHHREAVLHVRDYVDGMLFLQAQPGLALTKAQRQRLQRLLPAIRANMEGPPGLVDRKLETEIAGGLTAPQMDALKKWSLSARGAQDFMANLGRLERLAGASGAIQP